MKRLLSFLLTGIILTGLAAPCYAGELDTEMEAVMLQVIDVLEIPESYTEFSGYRQDGDVVRWQLEWYVEDGGFSVVAGEDGTVYNCYSYENGDYYTGNAFDPVLPGKTLEEMESTAEQWLERLMGEGETAVVEESSINLSSYDGTYSYYGSVRLSGMPSDLSFRMMLDADGKIRSYNRSDSWTFILEGLPSSACEMSPEEAGKLLEEVTVLELYWVGNEEEAELCYVPVESDAIVNAHTGEVIFNAQEDRLYNSYAAEADREMATAEGGRGLTEVELSAVEDYKEVLSEKKMNAILCGIEELGLQDGFSVEGSYYSQNSENGEILCRLSYRKEMTEENLYGYTEESFREYAQWGNDLTIYKTCTVNAKTGELVSVWTSYPLWEKEETSGKNVSVEESFLQKAAPEYFAETELCELSRFSGESVYAQKKDGYFYPDNYLTVEVNQASGTVDSYSCSWNEEVSFGSTEAVDYETALQAYEEAIGMELGYRLTALDPENPYEGYEYILAYYPPERDSVKNVRAFDASVRKEESDLTESFSYTDIQDCEQEEAISSLGQAGIGFGGENFGPEQSITQREALYLLLCAEGYSISISEEELIRQQALSIGFLTESEWNPEASVRRMDFVRMILDASAYSESTQLKGIWKESYRENFSEEEESYAALAQALGLVTEKKFRPDETLTRAEAAQILYNFLKR